MEFTKIIKSTKYHGFSNFLSFCTTKRGMLQIPQDSDAAQPDEGAWEPCTAPSPMQKDAPGTPETPGHPRRSHAKRRCKRKQNPLGTRNVVLLRHIGQHSPRINAPKGFFHATLIKVSDFYPNLRIDNLLLSFGGGSRTVGAPLTGTTAVFSGFGAPPGTPSWMGVRLVASYNRRGPPASPSCCLRTPPNTNS